MSRPLPAPASAPTARPDFREVYREQIGYVWSLLLRLGAPRADVKDLAQDVFATAFRQWSSYDFTRPVRPWLYSFVFRTLQDSRRKLSRKLELVVPELPELDAPGQDAVEHLQRREGLSVAQQLILGLELERRAVFVMVELEELSMPQVAEALGIPLNTAYTRLRLARRDFEAALKRLQAKEGRHE